MAPIETTTTDIDGEQDNTRILRVAPNSPPQAVANSIARSIFDDGVYPTVRSIGHGATGQACKAIAIARGLVAPRGIDLGVTIGFADVPGRDGKGTISAQNFETYKR